MLCLPGHRRFRLLNDPKSQTARSLKDWAEKGRDVDHEGRVLLLFLSCHHRGFNLLTFMVLGASAVCSYCVPGFRAVGSSKYYLLMSLDVEEMLGTIRMGQEKGIGILSAAVELQPMLGPLGKACRCMCRAAMSNLAPKSDDACGLSEV